MSKEKDKFLCVLPWNHQFIANDGSQCLCCLSQAPDLKLGTSISDSKTQVELGKIKKQMQNGEVPEHCRYCHKIEKSGRSSFRHYVNRLFPDTYQGIALNRLNNEVGIEFVDLRFGNKCNLVCRMCGPDSSFSLHKEFNHFFGTQGRELYELDAEDIPILDPKYKNLQRINIAGGEPFVMPNVYKFIGRLSRHENARNITLTFNSNMTHFDEKHIELWSAFKKIEVAASVDGYRDLNEYIRHPSKWEKVINNISKIKEFAYVYVNCTVQIYNIFSLGDLFKFFIGEFDMTVNLNILHEPRYLSIQALPLELKQRAGETIEKLRLKYPNRKDLEPLISFLNSNDLSEFFPDFIKWTKYLDRNRNQSLVTAAPEFKNFIN